MLISLHPTTFEGSYAYCRVVWNNAQIADREKKEAIIAAFVSWFIARTCKNGKCPKWNLARSETDELVMQKSVDDS